MQGVGDNRFDPEGTLTRAQVAQICYNAYKTRLTGTTDKTIGDVVAGVWYRDATYWMVASGVINGTTGGDGKVYFYPDAVADRKYVALVLYRLAGKLGVELPKAKVAVVFPDIGGLGNEYQKAIGALQQAGVIDGFPDGTYEPNGSLTRSQAAKLFDIYTNIEGLGVTATIKPPVVDPPVTGSLQTPDEFYSALGYYAALYGFSMGEPSTITVESGIRSDINLTNSNYTILIRYYHTSNMSGEIFAYYVYDSNWAEIDGSVRFVYDVADLKPVLEKYSN
jgi:hypothetical protein